MYCSILAWSIISNCRSSISVYILHAWLIPFSEGWFSHKNVRFEQALVALCCKQIVHQFIWLYSCTESRQILMPVLVTIIQQHLIQKQDMRTCAEILGSILTALHHGTAVSMWEPLGMPRVIVFHIWYWTNEDNYSVFPCSVFSILKLYVESTVFLSSYSREPWEALVYDQQLETSSKTLAGSFPFVQKLPVAGLEINKIMKSTFGD